MRFVCAVSVICCLGALTPLANANQANCVVGADGKCVEQNFHAHPALNLDAWYHSGGSFTHQGNGRWIENDGGLTQLHFEEVSRDLEKREVVLFDRNRGVTIEIEDGRSFFKFGTSKTHLFLGNFVPLTLDLASGQSFAAIDKQGTRWQNTRGEHKNEFFLDDAESTAEALVLRSAGDSPLAFKLFGSGVVQVFNNDQWTTVTEGEWRFPDRQDKPTLRKTKPDIFPPPRATQNPRVALLTLSTPNIAHYAMEAEKNQREYAKRHGYTLIVYRDSLIEWEQAKGAWHSIVTWNKIRAVMDTLASEHGEFDWVVWIDSDAIFTDLDKQLEEIFSLEPTKEFLVCKDPKDWLLNTGVMMFRNSPWCKDMLERLWDMPKVQHSSGAEQNQLIKLLQHIDDSRTHWHLFPECTFNCHPSNHKPGMFVVHYMGMGSSFKEQSIRDWNRKLGL